MIEGLKDYKINPLENLDHRFWFELNIGPRCLSVLQSYHPSLYIGQNKQILDEISKRFKEIDSNYPKYIIIKFIDEDNKNHVAKLKTRTVAAFRELRLNLAKVFSEQQNDLLQNK